MDNDEYEMIWRTEEKSDNAVDTNTEKVTKENKTKKVETKSDKAVDTNTEKVTKENKTKEVETKPANTEKVTEENEEIEDEYEAAMLAKIRSEYEAKIRSELKANIVTIHEKKRKDLINVVYWMRKGFKKESGFNTLTDAEFDIILEFGKDKLTVANLECTIANLEFILISHKNKTKEVETKSDKAVNSNTEKVTEAELVSARSEYKAKIESELKADIVATLEKRRKDLINVVYWMREGFEKGSGFNTLTDAEFDIIPEFGKDKLTVANLERMIANLELRLIKQGWKKKVVDHVMLLIDMSGSMYDDKHTVIQALKAYFRKIMEKMNDDTRFYLWFFHNEIIPIYEGILNECDIEQCVQKYMPGGNTGLYRVQYYAIKKLKEIQEKNDDVYNPCILLVMTDGRNNHKSTCMPSDIMRIQCAECGGKECDVSKCSHPNNPEIDRSLLVLEKNGLGELAWELGIEKKNFNEFGRKEEKKALEKFAIYTDTKSVEQRAMYGI